MWLNAVIGNKGAPPWSIYRQPKEAEAGMYNRAGIPEIRGRRGGMPGYPTGVFVVAREGSQGWNSD